MILFRPWTLPRRTARTYPYTLPAVFCLLVQGPVEGTDKFDYRYTGRHDHGTLPALKSGGPHEELISALLVSSVNMFLLVSSRRDFGFSSGSGPVLALPTGCKERPIPRIGLSLSGPNR